MCARVGRFRRFRPSRLGPSICICWRWSVARFLYGANAVPRHHAIVLAALAAQACGARTGLEEKVTPSLPEASTSDAKVGVPQGLGGVPRVDASVGAADASMGCLNPTISVTTPGVGIVSPLNEPMIGI